MKAGIFEADAHRMINRLNWGCRRLEGCREAALPQIDQINGYPVSLLISSFHSLSFTHCMKQCRGYTLYDSKRTKYHIPYRGRELKELLTWAWLKRLGYLLETFLFIFFNYYLQLQGLLNYYNSYKILLTVSEIKSKLIKD